MCMAVRMEQSITIIMIMIFCLRQMRDENYSGYYQEVSASEFETYKASFTYKKLEMASFALRTKQF